MDNKRLPAVPVQIVFSDPGGWITYGVSGAMQSRRFIRALKIPADFPYTSTTFTGYGGVLLVSDVLAILWLMTWPVLSKAVLMCVSK